MGIFDRFPYSSTHEMNLDFMLGKATEIAESLQEIDTHKEQAEQAATNAAQSAQSAVQAAQAAAGSQTAAGTSASQAAQHKADAEDAADRAEAASNLADEAVEQAQAAATTAGTAAQNASTAADGAIASATAAETRINTLAASLPEDFTELNTEVTNLKSAVNQLSDEIDYLGFSENSFSYTNGSTHSSTSDKVFLKIKEGQKFTVSVKSSDNSNILVSPIAYRPNGVGDALNYISFTGSGSKEYTASADYSSIGLYIGNSFASCNITFKVDRDDSILYIAPFTSKIDEAVSNIIYENKAQFSSNDFQRGAINGSTGELLNYQFRVCSYGHAFKFSYKLNITANSGFRFGIVTFDENGNLLSDSGWQTSYTMPANTIFKIGIGRTTEITSEVADIDYFVSQLYFDTKSASEIRDLQPLEASYYYDGNPLEFKKNGYNIRELFSAPAKPAGATGTQAFAINNGVLFQLYNDDKVTLVEFPNGSNIATLDINSGHGDSIDFSNEYYDQTDEFPLAYITANTTPVKVYVVRITRSAASLIRTLYFADTSKTGYMAGHCLDKNNNVLYMVGYTENSYYLDESGTNLMIVSKWDLKNCTTNQDGTLTPSFMESFTIPFIRTAQGQQYFREKIYIVSSHNLAGGYPIDTKVYVVDPFKRIITNILTDFPTAIKDVETEGIDFVLDDTEYNMILGNIKYYELSFK